MSVKQGRDALDDLAGVLSGTHRCANVTHLLHTKENKPVIGSVVVLLYVNALCVVQGSMRERYPPEKDLCVRISTACLPGFALPIGIQLSRENDLIKG